MDRHDRMALLTGASRDLGKALASPGAGGAANPGSGPVGAEKAVSAIRPAASGVSAPARALVEQPVEVAGRLNGLVNDAGVSVPSAGRSVDRPRFDRGQIARVRLDGASCCGQAAARAAIGQGSGTSGNSRSAHPPITLARGLAVVYPTARATINPLTRSLALEHAAHGTAVHALVVSLASGAAGHLPGETLRVEGGGALVELRRTRTVDAPAGETAEES
jgi:NAD(P)-dependent dehydrogenase (short-subunit alcohol dehydrogenase family)